MLSSRMFVSSLVILLMAAAAPQPRAKPSIRAELVLSEAKAAALRMKDDFKRGLILDEIGAAEAKNGDIDAAIDTVNRAYPHTMSALTAIGDRLSTTGDLVRARAIGPKLRGGEASTIFAVIADHQAREGKIEEALHTAGEIQAPEVRSYALLRIARQQAERGDYTGARKTVGTANALYPAQPLRPDEIEMMIAEGQVSRGEIQQARTTINLIKSRDGRSGALLAAAEVLREKGDRDAARDWLDEALRTLPADESSRFRRYFAIPTEVKLGLKEEAMREAGSLPPEMRLKGYAAVAVTCAEEKDLGGVNAALAELRSMATEGQQLWEFEANLMMLHVTAALIDVGVIDEAIQLLSSLREHIDKTIEPETELQSVVTLVKQKKFDDARSLALRIRRGAVSEEERGTALRIVALVAADVDGISSTRRWISALSDAEDQAYALLGLGQALIGGYSVHLPYNAIFIH